MALDFPLNPTWQAYQEPKSHTDFSGKSLLRLMGATGRAVCCEVKTGEVKTGPDLGSRSIICVHQGTPRGAARSPSKLCAQLWATLDLEVNLVSPLTYLLSIPHQVHERILHNFTGRIAIPHHTWLLLQIYF